MGVIIADLPTTSDITLDSYVIIEKPGVGEGTYKSTIEDLQSPVTTEVEDLRWRVGVLTTRLEAAEEVINKLKSTMMWKGTKEQWQALSHEERIQYQIVNIIDE